jgi:lysine-specific demethylase 8
MTYVENIERVTHEYFLRELIGRYRPVVITDVVPTWRASSLWSTEYLSTRVGDKQVAVQVSRNGKFTYDQDQRPGHTIETMTIARLARIIDGKEPAAELHYLHQIPISKELPELLVDLDAPAGMSGDLVLSNFWFGVAGTTTQLHFDQLNNYLCQVRGRKRVTIFDPAQTKYLYQYPMGSPRCHGSPVDIECATSRQQYPLIEQARYAETVLEPGEMLFLPAYWWHHVRALDAAISVNFWWKPEASQNLAECVTRELPERYRRDRLSSTAGWWGELGFLDAARLALDRHQLCVATLLAAAAWQRAVPTLGPDAVAKHFDALVSRACEAYDGCMDRVEVHGFWIAAAHAIGAHEASAQRGTDT